MSTEYARAVADAVLYEGYLLYPYRATSAKNQSRWQFGSSGRQGRWKQASEKTLRWGHSSSCAVLAR